MKVTKSELKEMIREAIREELGNKQIILESAASDIYTDEDPDNIFEGIFDSKATKQKAYTQFITDTFKRAPSAVAMDIASKATSAIHATTDCLDDDNSSTSKAAAKNFISAITSAKAGVRRTPYGLLDRIIAFVQKYNKDATTLDDLIEFKRTAIKAQSKEKNSDKAVAYLLELINEQLSTRLDKTIDFLKKEYSLY